MDITEYPTGDSETGEANGVTEDQSTLEDKVSPPAIKGGANMKRIKTTIAERVVIGVIITVVIVVAICGVVFTLGRKSSRGDYNNNSYESSQPYDPYGSFGRGDTHINKPFNVADSLFTSNETKPYASTYELRKDIEALVFTYANSVIMQQANIYQAEPTPFFGGPEHGLSQEFDGAAAPSSSVAKDNMMKDSSPVFEGVDDFETYQHEAGVVKNDLVKSNGAYVFVAMNNRINVFDVKGNAFESSTIASEGGHTSINGMLMSSGGDKLVVIASEYPDYAEGLELSIIVESRRTKVTIFNIDGSTLTENSQTYIDGYNVESYMIGDNVHIVTRMSLRKWEYLDRNLYRWKIGEMLTNEQYVEKATALAQTIIPEFIDEILDYFTEGDEIILSRLVGLSDSSNAYTTINQVYSFDLSKTGDEGGIEFSASRSLVMTQGNNANVYATNEWIWVTDTTFAWHLEQQDYNTMLLGFRLDGASSKFAALGTFPGEISSQFSIDFKKEGGKEYVRVAVTQNFFNDFWVGRPMPRPMPTTTTVQRESKPVIDGMIEDAVDEAEDAVFEEIDEESRTLNKVIIFEIPEPSDSQEVNRLMELGSIEVGKKHETITAVRFFDNISYVVTFERTDPFYVLDLSDPMNPEILGELEVPGFSEFMHPIKEDNTMLLTVGQDADENGRVTGLQISIFDSTTPNDPKLVSRLVVESASSSASWDERAFRYVQVDDVGRLIIPLYDYLGWDRLNSFDGFTVFGVDLNRTDMITREIEINHIQSRDSKSENQCYGYLPERSFIFDGNLMTMKASTVISTNLVSEEIQWSHVFQGESYCHYWH